MHCICMSTLAYFVWVYFVSPLMFYSGREACQRFARTSPPQSVSLCPGDRVNYTCTVSDSFPTVTTAWTGSVLQQCSGLLLAQYASGVPDPTSSRSCGNLSAMTTDITGTCYTSVLTIAFPQYVNGSRVACASGGVTFGNETLNVLIACPPSQPTITPVSCTSSSLTINWTKPFGCGSPISQYTLTTNPPSQNCNPSCTQFPYQTQATLLVQPNRNTTMTLRADNCGGTQAGQTRSTSYIIQTMGYVLDFSGMAVFDAQSQYAEAIRFSWSPQPMQLLPDEMSCGFYQNYTLKIVRPLDITHIIPVWCIPPNCSYEFSVGENMTALVFNCSIKDHPGEIQISSLNDIMAVSVTGAVVNCTFLSGLVGTSGCVVSFGTSPDHLPYTLISSQSGGSGQSITIPLVLNGVPLPPAAAYYYEVYLWSQDGSQRGVIVRGSFTTADQPTSATTALISSVRSALSGMQTAIAIGVGVAGGVLSLLVVVVVGVIVIIAVSKHCRHKSDDPIKVKRPEYEDTVPPGYTGKLPAYEDTAPSHARMDLELNNTEHESSSQTGVAKVTETGLVYATVSASNQPSVNADKNSSKPMPIDDGEARNCETAVVYSTVVATQK